MTTAQRDTAEIAVTEEDDMEEAAEDEEVEDDDEEQEEWWNIYGDKDIEDGILTRIAAYNQHGRKQGMERKYPAFNRQELNGITEESYKKKFNRRVCNSLRWNLYRPNFGEEAKEDDDDEWWSIWGDKDGPRACDIRVKEYNSAIPI